MNEAEVREKYPQYNDLPYSKLLEGLHAKHYSDMPYDEFAAKMGVSPQAPQQTQPQAPAPSFYDRLRESLMGAKSVAGEFAAGANRAVTGTLDFIGPDTINAGLRLAGVDAQVPGVGEVVESMTGFRPGQGGYMAPGAARDAVGALGSTLTAAGGLVSVPRNLATAGGAIAEVLGAGSASPVSATGRALTAMEFPIDTLTDAAGKKLSLLRGQGDAATAGLMLDDAGNVIKDAAQRAAQWQGFDPGFTSYVRSANPDTRRKMTAMLDIVDQAKKNWRSGLDARPLNVLGDSVLNRIKVVREANRVAGVRLDGVADALKGEQVEISPAVGKFLHTLEEMGMKYNPSTNTLDLIQGSATQDMPKVQKEAARILKRLRTTRQEGVLDGFDVHVMKKWIDNNVDYAKSGKGKSGMIGSLDRAIKGLRHDLDSVLDTQFPEYNKVNTQYAETRGALDEVQDIAGKKFDPTDDSAALTMGSLTRRFLSNAQSNGYLRDSVARLDETARKYITPGTDLVPYKPIQARSGVTPAMLENDDLIGLAGYADELDKVFGPASKTSLFGDVDKAVQRGVDATQMTAAGMTAAALKYGWKKAARVNEERAMKAMRELLKESK